MQKLSITVPVINAYQKADESGKSLLVSLFGEDLKDAPLPADITERVYNLETACHALGKDMGTLFGNETDEYKKAQIAIETFAEAMREGTPAKESFYYPFFRRSSGGGLSYLRCGGGNNFSDVGARLRVPDGKKAQHMGKCMLEYYRIIDNG